MKFKNTLCLIIIFSLLITLLGCNRVAAIEFEGVTISTNDSFHLSMGEHIKDKWRFSEKKKVLDIIQRFEPRDEGSRDLLGGSMRLRVETDEYTISIRLSGEHTIVGFSKRGVANRHIWYICSYDDMLTMGRFLFYEGWLYDWLE